MGQEKPNMPNSDITQTYTKPSDLPVCIQQVWDNLTGEHQRILLLGGDRDFLEARIMEILHELRDIRAAGMKPHGSLLGRLAERKRDLASVERELRELGAN